MTYNITLKLANLVAQIGNPLTMICFNLMSG